MSIFSKKLTHTFIATIALFCIVFCILLFDCKNTTEEAPDIFTYEGMSESWTATAQTPAAAEHDEEYIKVTFVYDSTGNPFSEGDFVSFGIGTFIGSAVYTYSKTDGYIRSEYSLDPIGQDRIICVSEDTFEVFYDIELFDFTYETDGEQSIVISIVNKAGAEAIKLEQL